MKNFRKEKGITLVALIITIVILLILAAVAIAAIQNENILSHANNAAVKYNGSVDNEQGILGGYLDVLDKYTGNEWITIYEGSATTDEDGIAALGEGDLFAYGGVLGVTYKITVSSDEYTGTIETVPIFIGTEEGMNIYALFAVANGQAVGFTSLEDAQNKVTNLGENVTLVYGISQAGMYGIMLLGATCDYTITKIERKEIELESIYEGVVAKISSYTGAIIEKEIDLTKMYLLEYNGATYYTTTLVAEDGDVLVSIGSGDDIICVVDINEGNSIIAFVNPEEAEGKSIRLYELGDNPNVVTEGEYIAAYRGNDKWNLISENLSAGIPETVGGKTITGIEIIRSNLVYYDREVEIINTLEMIGLNIKVASSINLERFFEIAPLTKYGTILDLTEFSEATIPESVLTLTNSGYVTIYVTESVKENYADYTNVVVKQ